MSKLAGSLGGWIRSTFFGGGASASSEAATGTSRPREAEGPLDPPEGDLKDWLKRQAEQHALTWLYAEFDDGLVWGLFDQASRGLRTAADVYDDTHVDRTQIFEASQRVRVPPVRLATLRRLYAFSENGCIEVLRLREKEFGATRVRVLANREEAQEGERVWTAFEDRTTLLAGSRPLVAPKDGFTLAFEPTTGTRHALPVALVSGGRAALTWRGYLPTLVDADPETHLGHPVWWRPIAVTTSAPQT